MGKVKVLILRTAGTNCDLETDFAFKTAGAETELVHVGRLVEGAVKLEDFDILTIPGGFTYGDDIAAGRVLAVELMNSLGNDIREFVSAKKPVLGICNGFQVLVKMGLLPNMNMSFLQNVTLTANDSNKFEDRWTRLECTTDKCIFTEKDSIVEYPVAHMEGKFVAADDSVIDELFERGQVVYQYVDADGGSPGYPGNPNGSVRDIAAICDPTGTVLGLMPHPERYVLPTQHPTWTRTGLKPVGDGLKLFKNAVEYVMLKSGE